MANQHDPRVKARKRQSAFKERLQQTGKKRVVVTIPTDAEQKLKRYARRLNGRK